jgi:hypothetical protein
VSGKWNSFARSGVPVLVAVTAVAVDEAGWPLEEKVIRVGSDELLDWAAARAGARLRDVLPTGAPGRLNVRLKPLLTL